jgi:hypothetical protein
VNHDKITISLHELCDGIRKKDLSLNKVCLPVLIQSHVDLRLKALDGNTTVTSLVLLVYDERSRIVSKNALYIAGLQFHSVERFVCQLSSTMNKDTSSLDELCDGIRRNDPSMQISVCKLIRC